MIDRMPLVRIKAYLQRIPAMQAEGQLVAAGPAMLPHMSKEDKRRAVQNWERAAGATRRKRFSTDGELVAMGVRVEHV